MMQLNKEKKKWWQAKVADRKQKWEKAIWDWEERRLFAKKSRLPLPPRSKALAQVDVPEEFLVWEAYLINQREIIEEVQVQKDGDTVMDIDREKNIEVNNDIKLEEIEWET